MGTIITTEVCVAVRVCACRRSLCGYWREGGGEGGEEGERGVGGGGGGRE